MTVWQAAILGIVQGLTEFLPISSSGHLVILQQVFQLETSVLTFDIVIHLATLVAILIFFGKGLFSVTKREWFLVGIGTIPAVVIGLFFKDQIEALFLNDRFVGVELIITGLINFYADSKINSKLGVEKPVQSLTQISKKTIFHSLGIGFAQAVAIIPGISRSGSTVATAIGLGVERKNAFRFAFLLAIPALLGAGILQLKDVTSSELMAISWPVLITGIVTAFVSGVLSLKLFKYVIEKAKLEWFGWYCVILGLVLLLMTFI